MKEKAVQELMETKQYLALCGDRSVAVIPDGKDLKIIGIDYARATWRKIKPKDKAMVDPNGINESLLRALFELHKTDPVFSRKGQWTSYQ